MLRGVIEAIRRELHFVGAVIPVLRRIRRLDPAAEINVATQIEGLAREHADRPALLDESGRSLSYREMDELANRVGSWALSRGLGRGDVVALVLENRIEYIVFWLGLLKVGIVVSLVNTTVRATALEHCLDACDARFAIVDGELPDEVAETCRRAISEEGVVELDVEGALLRAVQAFSPEPPDRCHREGLRGADRAFFIYTSGTTGVPKAAVISHHRWLLAGEAFAGLVKPRPADRMMLVLPLYHSTGGMVAPGLVFSGGGSLIVCRKFSASRFWNDCQRLGATLFQYVGELCRYLTNASADGVPAHSLRMAIGNGLRPEVWGPFVERCRIPRVLEFYASTEGNITLFNIDGRPGCIGRLPGYMSWLSKFAVVQYDAQREEPIRDSRGRCIRCAPGEAGEAIGEIRASDMKSRVDGYTDEDASEKKILKDVFREGDLWFRSGDLLSRDALGYYRFVDRIGDTFRFKGENVSTQEVAEVLAGAQGVQEAVVYGVELPGVDGRVGMAALVTTGELDGAALWRHVAAALPDAARPRFLRIREEISTTGTFKQLKLELQREGIAGNADPLLIAENRTYVPLEERHRDELATGQRRL